jgi:hypothetical protein
MIKLSYSVKSDVFSFMMMLYGIFKLKTDKYGSPHFLQSHDINLVKNKLRELDSDYARKEFAEVFPTELRGLASRSLSVTPSMRPELSEIKMNSWFQDELVKGIYYMENFYTLPEANKKKFLTFLANKVKDYSREIVEKRIVPFITTNMVQPDLMHGLTLISLVIVEKKLVREERVRYGPLIQRPNAAGLHGLAEEQKDVGPTPPPADQLHRHHLRTS